MTSADTILMQFLSFIFVVVFIWLRVSECMNPDQHQFSVSPFLDPNYLQMLADDRVKASTSHLCVVSLCLFVCFVALRPKSTAMVMAGRSVHLTTFFLGKLEQAVNQYFVHILRL